jgi:hypothetical protein
VSACFVDWLAGEARRDDHDSLDYSELFEFGSYFRGSLGDEPPDPPTFKVFLDLEGHAEGWITELLRQLVVAEATWRANTAGELLQVKPSKCGFRGLDGVECPRRSVLGTPRCEDHGGAITDPAVRGSLLLLAYAQMVEGTAKAVTTLIDVMDSSKNDLARVQAAKEMLDRAGLTPEQTAQATAIQVETQNDQLERVKRRLDTVRVRLLPPSDDDIIEAEIIEEAATG